MQEHARSHHPTPEEVAAKWLIQGIEAFQHNDFTKARKLLELVLTVDPAQPTAHHFIACAACQQGEIGVALGHLRAALASTNGTPAAYNTRLQLRLVLRETKLPAELADFSSKLKPTDLAPKALVACMPKSGSTYAAQLLSQCLGLPWTFTFEAAHQNEQELSESRMEEIAQEKAVIQCHTRATEPNIHLLQAYGVNPIVQTRNIFDALWSMTDFIAGGFRENLFYIDCPCDWPRERILELVIRKYSYWYIEFYASWVIAEREGRLPIYWLAYEKLVEAPQQTVEGIAAHCGLPLLGQNIGEAVRALRGSGVVRKNKGVAGRGQGGMSQTQKDHIKQHTVCFPDIDFSPIGL